MKTHTQNFSRRDFFKTSATLTLAGVAFGSPMLAFGASPKSGVKMQFSTLNDGRQIPLVGFGTSRMNGAECQKAVENAFGVGYRLIDTAQMYNNESDVGNAIKTTLGGKKIKREEMFITTKLSSDMSYDETLKATEESLKKLQVEYVDLLLIHKNYKRSKDMYRAMEKLQQDGVIKSLGISNFTPEMYNKFIKNCKVIPAINQMETHIFFQQTALRKAMQAKGTKLEAWSPFANGQNDFFKNETLAKIAKKHKKSVAQVALRFLIEQDIVVIPKSSKIERMKENINIFDFTLDDEDRQTLIALDTNEPLFKWF